MDTRCTERDLHILKLYAIGATAVLGVLSVSAFTQGQQRARFTEIDVERIHVREPDISAEG
jgi:hypothetical protein